MQNAMLLTLLSPACAIPGPSVLTTLWMASLPITTLQAEYQSSCQTTCCIPREQVARLVIGARYRVLCNSGLYLSQEICQSLRIYIPSTLIQNNDQVLDTKGHFQRNQHNTYRRCLGGQGRCIVLI